MTDSDGIIEIAQRKDDEYEKFLEDLKYNFNQIAKVNKVLYTVKTDGLWDAFINHIPEDARQHYNCRTCRHFVERYGGLVIITDDGDVQSALWDIDTSRFFKEPLAAMNELIHKTARVNGVFVSDTRFLGKAVTGIW